MTGWGKQRRIHTAITVGLCGLAVIHILAPGVEHLVALLVNIAWLNETDLEG